MAVAALTITTHFTVSVTSMTKAPDLLVTGTKATTDGVDRLAEIMCLVWIIPEHPGLHGVHFPLLF